MTRAAGQFPKCGAFTLLEVLVASGILVAMLGFLLVVMDQTTRIWSGTSAKVEQFREARTGFERVSTRLSQATLNTYWDYDYNTASPPVPTRYARRSELRFIAGSAATILGNSGTVARVTHAIFFNAPLGITGSTSYAGLANALNTFGYFTELGDDTGQRPPFITTAMIPLRWRFRLMEFSQPTENFNLYQFTSGTPTAPNLASSYAGTDWFKTDVNNSPVLKRVVTENVVALIITPRLAKADEALQSPSNATHSPLAPNFSYDSTGTNVNPQLNPKNQLPPVVQLTMVAIDERSAERLDLTSVSQVDVFKTAARFTDTRNLPDDLAALETTLAARHIRYRIFTTNVHIRAAKWSREQAN